MALSRKGCAPILLQTDHVRSVSQLGIVATATTCAGFLARIAIGTATRSMNELFRGSLKPIR